MTTTDDTRYIVLWVRLRDGTRDARQRHFQDMIAAANFAEERIADASCEHVLCFDQYTGKTLAKSPD